MNLVIHILINIMIIDAERHGLALRRGALKASSNSIGYLSWHFTVDEDSIVQHLPTNERGEHADYDGPGNRKSIGIEMCENSGNSRSDTLKRTAHLTAWLMKEYQIPIENVVPHNHWVRVTPKGRNLGKKNCPHFLLSKGRKGWKDFIDLVEDQ